ncbi:MAG TPA: hypothetical protein VGA08_00670 [Candidatus Saccharimonadales bacterium]
MRTSIIIICLGFAAVACRPALVEPESPGGPTPLPPADNAVIENCVVAGCSNEICAEPGGQIFSTCVYQEWYACLETAVCKRQPNGSCGWTPTQELQECLQSKGGSLE